MGIDVYMRWHGQSDDEVSAQYPGFSIAHGHVGYLRESYHGPSATRVLVPEAFERETPIPASVLRKRLADARDACRQQYRDAPQLADLAERSLIDFVALAERKEAETGRPVTIVVS